MNDAADFSSQEPVKKQRMLDEVKKELKKFVDILLK